MKRNPSGDWRPNASLEILRRRAEVLARIREFFRERCVLEVDTPILSAAGTPDPALASLTVTYTGPEYAGGRTLYMQTSPEFPMKRLLAAGTGSIYQICKVFRDGESGRLHNPEFTMLEWYRVNMGYHELMDEVDALVRFVIGERIASIPTEKITYAEAFQRTLAIDPHQAMAKDFAALANERGIRPPDALLTSSDASVWRDLLLTHLVEPELGRDQMTFVYDFPASQASLARIRPEHPPLAERFELYCHGIELANGFHELTDVAEHRVRFERQNHTRTHGNQQHIPIDNHLLSALEHGLPDCSGVAMGVDRLVMLDTELHDVASTLSFPIDRA